MLKGGGQKHRIYAFDFLRVLAIFAVIMVHCSSPLLLNNNAESFAFAVGNIFDSLSRLGVGIFFMISGALMLDEKKNLTFKKCILKALKIFGILIFWSLFYAIFHSVVIPLLNDSRVLLGDFVNRLLFANYHLWFLYVIIGLYLITPILRLFVKIKNSKYVLYFVILAVIFEFLLPLSNLILSTFTGINNLAISWISQFSLDFVCGFTTYYLLGWYISNVPIKKKARIFIYIIALLSLILTIIFVFVFCKFVGHFSYMVIYENLSLNILLYALGLFLFVFYLFKNGNIEKIPNFVLKLSNLTFGVYLIHDFILVVVRHFINVSNVYLNLSIIWILVTTISFVICYVISLIPYFNKVIKS